MTIVRKSEIENLAAGFRAEVIAEIVKHRGGKALGVVGGFIANIEAHRGRYARKLATIRVGADPATITLASETERKTDALAKQEIQRVRAAGRVELNPDEEDLSLAQQPPHAIVDPSPLNVAPVGEETMAEETGPQKYAPPDRRAPEQGSDVERIAFLRQQRSQANSANDPAAQLNAVVNRVASASLEEIDRVIRTLEGVRDMMREEGERVSREVAGYASLSHAAVTAMKVMADSIKEWKVGPNKSGPGSVS
jgi:hypothetical protein